MAVCAHDNKVTCPTVSWNTTDVTFHCLPSNPESDTEKSIYKWVMYPVSTEWFENVLAFEVHFMICLGLCFLLNILTTYMFRVHTEIALKT